MTDLQKVFWFIIKDLNVYVYLHIHNSFMEVQKCQAICPESHRQHLKELIAGHSTPTVRSMKVIPCCSEMGTSFPYTAMVGNEGHVLCELRSALPLDPKCSLTKSTIQWTQLYANKTYFLGGTIKPKLNWIFMCHIHYPTWPFKNEKRLWSLVL